ncbi:hypothetical protein EIP91_010896 [Steccherinum ochraceum]|uniref:Uncharacterized protein n=1 Tax=Steccherinum ochraceum TaxID=92696 RepID=A0A4V2MX17_9APHY|nr:hypothetical protein EIP91_010896 [Steccherinum ochraceum]
MSTTPSYAPDESSSQLWLEQAILDGGGIENVAYGVQLTLFLLCFNHLWSERKDKTRTRTYFWMVYIVILFSLGTIGNAVNMRITELSFVDNRNFPGGPSAYEVELNFIPLNIAGTAAYIINGWLQDGLLLYRYYVIVCTAWWMIVVPAALFLLTIIMSLFLLVQLAQPGATLWEASNVNFALVYWSSSIATTILLTCLIVGRLFYTRYQVRAALGPRYQASYFSVSALLIESAFLYTSVAIIFLVTYARNSTVNFLFFGLLGQMESIAPLMIILRVAQGRAFHKNTFRDLTTMSQPNEPIQFGSGTGPSFNLSTATTASVPPPSFTSKTKTLQGSFRNSTRGDPTENMSVEMLALAEKAENEV